MDIETKIRLLIVDDDVKVLGVLESLFEDDPHIDAMFMNESAQALQLMRQREFDLVITDLMMPAPDGLVVARAAKECLPDALVIIITGYASLETTLQAIEVGVHDYITKPFQIDEFRLKVANASRFVMIKRENRMLRERVRMLTKEIVVGQDEQNELRAEAEEMRAHLRGAEAMEMAAGTAVRSRPAGDTNKVLAYRKASDRAPYRPRLRTGPGDFAPAGEPLDGPES